VVNRLTSSGKSYVSDLAEAAGVDSKTFERWITKGRTPHRVNAVRAAQALWPDFNRLLRDKAAGGCRVTVLLGDPESDAVALRGKEEAPASAPHRLRQLGTARRRHGDERVTGRLCGPRGQ
jgi:IS5 family transposase